MVPIGELSEYAKSGLQKSSYSSKGVCHFSAYSSTENPVLV